MGRILHSIYRTNKNTNKINILKVFNMDLLIASATIVHNSRLWTENRKLFLIGLKSWFED